MKENKEKVTFGQKIAKTFDISKDIFSDIPRFTINDNNELRVENYKGIISYEFNEIKLGSKKYTIVINGESLKINSITDEDILIIGEISSMSFE